MPTPASLTAFIISDTKPGGPAAFPFFYLLIDSLNKSLPNKTGKSRTVSAWGKCKLCVRKFLMITFLRHFLIFTNDC